MAATITAMTMDEAQAAQSRHDQFWVLNGPADAPNIAILQDSHGKDLRFSPDMAVEKWPLRGSPAASKPCHWPMCRR